MIEMIETAALYTGAGSMALSVGLFIGGVSWNKIHSSQLNLPIYQELPEGNF